MEFPVPGEELAMDAHQWAAVLVSLPDLLVIVGADGYIEYVSPSVTKLLGVPPDSAIGRSACEFIAPEDRRNCGRWLAHARTTVDLPELTHGLLHQNGSVRSFESSVRLLPNAGGRAVIICRNVHERTTVDHQLAAMERMWTDIYDIVREGVVVVDSASVIISVNESAVKLIGTPADELIGRRIDDLFRVQPGPDDDPDAELARTLGRRENSRIVEMARPDGQVRTVRAYAVHLPHSKSRQGPTKTAVVFDPDPPGAWEPGTAPSTADFSLQDVLSPREIEVLQLLTQGLDVRAVSAQLGISIHTTRNYVKAVLHKLDVRTQLQAVVVAIRYGLLDL